MKLLSLNGIFLIAALHSIVNITSCQQAPDQKTEFAPDTVRVVSVRYFPVTGDRIDIQQTGDWGETLSFTRHKVDSVSSALQSALSEGTRYHGYSDPKAQPSLKYDVIYEYEFLEALPTFEQDDLDTPMTDYRTIMERIDAERWVQTKNAKEFWIWAYHGGVVRLWESNMSGPHADISNSDRISIDLPIFSTTYTVYHYNYQRGTAEAMENHMHQLEAVLNYFDGRDDAAYDEWRELLFWGKFVGSDSTHRLLAPYRAGWSHYPPNAAKDYEWSNASVVMSDIRNWNPDSVGLTSEISCEQWSCDHLKWFIFWTQNIPGRSSGLSYRGRPLRNWWTFLTDVDSAFSQNWRLWE